MKLQYTFIRQFLLRGRLPPNPPPLAPRPPPGGWTPQRGYPPSALPRVEECTYFWGVNTSWGIDTAESKGPLHQEDNQAPQPTEIVRMLILVTEKKIVKACRLVVGGERWWKKEHVVTEFVNQFMLPDKQNLNWKRGVPRSWIRPEWHTALIVIHRYITCEGRISLVCIYHIGILMHLNGDYPLNLPYFLLKILTKMSKRV
jgi:hypothetical protein